MVIVSYYVEASTCKITSQQKAFNDIWVKSGMSTSNRAAASIQTSSSELENCRLLHDVRCNFITRNKFYAPNDVCFIF